MVKNLYAELGSLARMMRTDPTRYGVLIGTLLDALGADHILWGTDTPVIGPPRWQIEAFQRFIIPETPLGSSTSTLQQRVGGSRTICSTNCGMIADRRQLRRLLHNREPGPDQCLTQTASYSPAAHQSRLSGRCDE